VPVETAVYGTHGQVAADLGRAALGSPSGLALGRTAITIAQLEAELVAAALPERRVLGPLEERLLLRHLTASDEVRAGWPTAVCEGRGFIPALAASVAACREAGLVAAELARASSALPSRAKARVRALASALAALERTCDSLGALDPGLAVIETSRALRAGAALPARLEPGMGLRLRHVRLTPARVRLLDALAQRLRPREVVVEIPHASGSGPWLAATRRLLGLLESWGERSALTVLPLDPTDAPGLGPAVARALVEPGVLGPPGVEVVHAPDPMSENAEVARVVRRWIDEGVPPERIAVAVSSGTTRGAALVGALERCGVPVQERRGESAIAVPAVRWLLHLIAMATSDVDREALLAAFASPHADAWLRDQGLPDGAVLARVVARAGARTATAEQIEASLERRVEEGHAAGIVRHALSALRSLREITAPFGESATIPDFVERVGALLSRVRLRETLERRPGGAARVRELLEWTTDPLALAEARSMGRDHAAMDSLLAGLGTLLRAARNTGVDRAFAPAVLLDALRDALDVHRISDGGLRGGAVRVLPLASLVGLDLDAIAMPGLRHGELPGPPAESPLLTLGDRLLLSRALSATGLGGWVFDVDARSGGGPTVFSTLAEQEPLRFVLGLTAARTRLLLTRPIADEGGRPVPASPFLEDTLAALGAQVRERALPCATVPPLSSSCGLDEVRRASMHRLAAVAPGVSAAAAAIEDLHWRVPRSPHPQGLEDMLERVAIERRRMAAPQGAERIEADAHAGMLSNVQPAVALIRQLTPGSPERPLSPSALESMALCPFRFYAHHLLRARPERPIDEDADRMRRGEIAHRCLEAAVEALLSAGVVPFRADLADRAVAVAGDAIRAEAEGAFAAVPLTAGVMSVATDDLVSDLVELVRALYEADDGYTPTAVEQSFGPGETWPGLVVPSSGGAIHVAGRIDLVESAPDGVRVSDLKTSGGAALKARLGPARLGVLDLQLPIYAAAAAGATTEQRVHARYLSLRDGPLDDVRETMRRSRAWREDARDPGDVLLLATADGRATALAARIVELTVAMRDGRFPVRPAPDACESCDYRALCRLPRGAEEGDR